MKTKKILHIIYVLFAILVSKIGIAQDVFYVSCNNALLLKCSLSTCSFQSVGNMNGHVMFDIAITPNGTLYGTTGKILYRIDTLNASTQFIGLVADTSSTGGYFLNSLVALDDNNLIAAGILDTVYRINVANGAKTPIGTTGFAPAGDLTWHDGKLLMTDVNNQLIEITLDQNYSSIQSVVVKGTMNTPFSSVYGAITIGKRSCESNTIQVIGFEGGDVFLINPTNANVNALCPSMLMCSAYGATSLSETILQQAKPVAVIPNVFTPNNDGINDFFSPEVNGSWKALEMFIYDRWGKRITIADQNKLKWDGMNAAEKCASGTYYYKISGIDYCNEEHTYTGFFQLIR